MNLSFVPRMQSEAHGFTVVEDLAWRGWGGVVADVWHVRCEADAHGSYVAPDPRLFVVLDITAGGRLELAVPGGPSAFHEKPFSMAYVPAHVPVTSRATGVEELRHLDIHLPEAAVLRRFGKAADPRLLNTTRLQFEDTRLARIAALLAEQCTSEDPLEDHFGAGLIDALLTALFDVRREKRRARPSLTRNQLSLSLDYIEAHCFETVRLHDLASRLGLSESHFSHAFKASTGIPPLRWQMEARIGKVKELLDRDKLSLTEISVIAGFSDQAHLTRSFKRLVGLTPSQWRRSVPAKRP